MKTKQRASAPSGSAPVRRTKSALHRIPAARQSRTDVTQHLKRTLEERWRKNRKAFDRCRRKLSEDAVHQLRVETRRLLAVLNLLDSLIGGDELANLRRALKKFLRSFASLRDTQVQWLFVERHRRKFPELGIFAQALSRLEQRWIRNLDKRIQRTGRKEIKRSVAALREILGPALDEAGMRTRGGKILGQHVRIAFNQVEDLRRRIDPERPRTIHRTRVAFKRFRYLMELLAPLLPGVSRRHLRAMHDYQTLMGEVQDREVLQSALRKFLKRNSGVRRELERFQQELAQQHAAAIARYLAQADQLRRFWPAGV